MSARKKRAVVKEAAPAETPSHSKETKLAALSRQAWQIVTKRPSKDSKPLQSHYGGAQAAGEPVDGQALVLELFATDVPARAHSLFGFASDKQILQIFADTADDAPWNRGDDGKGITVRVVDEDGSKSPAAPKGVRLKAQSIFAIAPLEPELPFGEEASMVDASLPAVFGDSFYDVFDGSKLASETKIGGWPAWNGKPCCTPTDKPQLVLQVHAYRLLESTDADGFIGIFTNLSDDSRGAATAPRRAFEVKRF